jgi:hypothetical protein
MILEATITILIYLIIIGMYFLPVIVGRNKNNLTGITLVTIFLGWTLLGWGFAMMWAIGSSRKTIKNK